MILQIIFAEFDVHLFLQFENHTHEIKTSADCFLAFIDTHHL